jgi:hypothetical protein
MYYAYDMYVKGKCLNQQEMVPHNSVTRFGLDEIDLSDRNKIKVKVSALRSPDPGE